MHKPVRMAALALAVLMGLLSACGKTAESDADSFLLYYVRSGDDSLESALESISWEGTQTVEVLFSRLCSDPAEEDLATCIPEGTSLLSWDLKDSVLSMDLSGEFGTLTGVELTLASWCITLTMCQLEGVSAVRITAEGETLLEDEILTPQQVMLDGGEGDTSTLYTTLYFPLSDGSGIGSERREIQITENRSESESILDALCAGPESKELSSFLPSSAEGITLWIKEDICYVNLTEEWQSYLEEDRDLLQQCLQCVVDSLAELDDVDSVQFLMDGAEISDWSDIGGDFPMNPSEDGSQ